MPAEQGVIGWTGLDAPVEVIHAAGCRAVRLDAGDLAAKGPTTAYAEGGGNPWMRATADRILMQAAQLDALVVGATPVQGVWLANFLFALQRRGELAASLHIEISNVSHSQRPSARAFNEGTMRRLAKRLGARPDALPAAIALRNLVRAAQRRIERRRTGAGADLSGSEARRLLDAADEMDGEAYVTLVGSQAATATSGVPVIYSGPGSPDLAAYLALEARGYRIVADDADFGTRAIGETVDPAAEPFAALAERYRRRSPAPAGWSTASRIDWLVGLAHERAASAVVFDIPGWAHPAAWDHPVERQALQAAGVRCLLLEEATATLADGVR